MKRLAFVAPLVLFAALTIYFAIGLQRDPSSIPSVMINKPAPNLSLPALEGIPGGLAPSDLDGEVRVVNFFGSWCVPCLIEHPLWMEIAGAGDVEILGVNWKDRPDDAIAWLERWGNPYTRVGHDGDSRAAIDFGVTGAPETFVIDQRGRIRYRFAGPINETIWEEDIAPLIAELRQ